MKILRLHCFQKPDPFDVKGDLEPGFLAEVETGTLTNPTDMVSMKPVLPLSQAAFFSTNPKFWRIRFLAVSRLARGAGRPLAACQRDVASSAQLLVWCSEPFILALNIGHRPHSVG